MGVYINMEMPKEGSCIQIVIDDDGKVYPSVDHCIMQIGSYATAVPVPPHGDLIDRDALPWEKQGLLEADEDWALPCCLIEDAPTIIPADPAEEGET